MALPGVPLADLARPAGQRLSRGAGRPSPAHRLGHRVGVSRPLPAMPGPARFLVDNNPDRWGREIDGLPVHPPDRLREEDPAAALVLVYSSFWPEVLRQAARDGLPPAVPASHLLAWPTLGPRLDLLHRFAAAPRRTDAAPSDTAIVVQGPVIAALTTLVLRYYAAANPGCPWSCRPGPTPRATSSTRSRPMPTSWCCRRSLSGLEPRTATCRSCRRPPACGGRAPSAPPSD